MAGGGCGGGGTGGRNCSPDIRGMIPVPQPDTPNIPGGTPMAGRQKYNIKCSLSLHNVNDES